MYVRYKKQAGFTIVELLIVVVVIAILAVITIVAYTGIQNRARDSSTAAQLSSAARKVELARVDNGDRYPVTITNLGLPASSGESYTYYTDPNQSVYCLALKKGASVTSVASMTQGTYSGGCAGATPGALAWWPMNGDGSESSGYDRSFTMQSGMLAATGQNGTTNSAVEFAASSQPTITPITLTGTSFAVSGWINVSVFNNTGSYAQAPMLGARSSAGGFYTAMHFGLRAANSSSNPRMYMDFLNSGQAGTTLVTTGSWYNLTYTYDQTTNTRKFYLNGVLDNTFTVGETYKGVVDVIGSNCCMTSGLRGRLDDVRVYNRVLSQSEVADMYALGAL